MSQFLTAGPGSPPDDWPHYGIGFLDAVKRAYRKYAVFSGRAGLGEYWWYALFFLLVFFGLGIIGAVLGALSSPDGGATPGPAGTVIGVLITIFYLASLIPIVSVTVRRLHDAGYSGWFYLLNFVPFAGVVPFVLTLLPTSPLKAAQYGPPYPLVAPPAYPGSPAHGHAPPPAPSQAPQ